MEILKFTPPSSHAYDFLSFYSVVVVINQSYLNVVIVKSSVNSTEFKSKSQKNHILGTLS